MVGEVFAVVRGGRGHHRGEPMSRRRSAAKRAFAHEIKRTERPPAIRLARGEFEIDQIAERNEKGDIIGHTKAFTRKSNLSRYWKRREITDRQYAAGVRFERDIEAVGAGGRSCLNLERTGGDPHIAIVGKGLTDRVQACRSAIGCLGYLKYFVVSVVLNGMTATEAGEGLVNPRQDGIAALRLGLDALADHYRLDF